MDGYDQNILNTCMNTSKNKRNKGRVIDKYNQNALYSWMEMK